MQCAILGTGCDISNTILMEINEDKFEIILSNQPNSGQLRPYKK